MSKDKVALKAQANSEIIRTLGIVGAASINVDSYLDFVGDVLGNFNWKAASWAERVGLLLRLAQITYDYYQEFVGLPDNDERRKTLVDTALVGWKYAKEAFSIELPMSFVIFEEWIVRTVVEAGFRFVVSRTQE